MSVSPKKNTEISDVQLVNDLISAKHGSFEQFYDKYNRLIYHCIRTKMSGKYSEDIDDVFQDFFAKLQSNNYKTLDMWNRNSSFINYISTVTRNFAADQIRSKKRDISKTDDVYEIEIIDPEMGPLHKLEQRSLRRTGIRAWLNLNSDRDKRLICNKYHRDKPYELIGKDEGLNGSATRQAIFQAQKRFLNILKIASPEYFIA